MVWNHQLVVYTFTNTKTSFLFIKSPVYCNQNEINQLKKQCLILLRISCNLKIKYFYYNFYCLSNTNQDKEFWFSLYIFLLIWTFCFCPEVKTKLGNINLKKRKQNKSKQTSKWMAWDQIYCLLHCKTLLVK